MVIIVISRHGCVSVIRQICSKLADAGVFSADYEMFSVYLDLSEASGAVFVRSVFRYVDTDPFWDVSILDLNITSGNPGDMGEGIEQNNCARRIICGWHLST